MAIRRSIGEAATTSKPARRSAKAERPAWPDRGRGPRVGARPAHQPDQERQRQQHRRRLDQDQVRGADETRDRTGQERPDECARDRRRGQQREEALRLAGVERRPGDRPVDRHDDRADDIDREPEREKDVLEPGTEGDAPADDQGRAEAEEPDEQASPGHPPEGRRVRKRHDEPRRPEAHVQEREHGRQAGRTVSPEHQRLDADLAERAPGLDQGEEGGDRSQPTALPGPHPDRASQARDRTVHRGG